MLLGSSIYLEVTGPDGRKLEPVRRIGMGGPPQDDMSDAATRLHGELAAGVRRAETRARKDGRDPAAAAAAFTREFNSKHGLSEAGDARELAPGESITTPTWTYPRSVATPTRGYAEMPFRFEKPGRYTVRLVHDYAFLGKLSRNGGRLRIPEAFHLATEPIGFEIVR